jgi:WD40 repeat protein
MPGQPFSLHSSLKTSAGWLVLGWILLISACQGAPAGELHPTPTFPGLPTASALPVRTLAPMAGAPTRALRPSATPLPTRASLNPPISTANLNQLTETVRLGNGTILHVAYAADGRTLAFATRRGIALLDAQTYRTIRTVEIEAGVSLIAFSPDGLILAAAGWDSKIRLYQVKDLGWIRTLDGGDIGQPLSLVFFTDGKTLCLGTTGDLTLLWEVETGKMARRWYTTGSNAMSDSSDGLFIATSTWEGNVYIWLVSNGKSQGRMWRDSPVLSVQFSPDSRLVAAGYADNSVVLWNAMDGKLRQTLKGHTQRVTELAFSPDSKMAASASWDATARLWDVESGKPVAVLEGHNGRVEQVAFSADGKIVTTLAEDGIVRFWRTNGELIQTLADFVPLGHAIFSPDGQLVATGVEDGAWRLWQVSDQTLVRSQFAHPGGISAMRFSPDGTFLVTGGLDKKIRVWKVADGALQDELDGAEGWINGLTISPDGSLVAASSTSSVVRIWSLKTGRLEKQIEAGNDTILDLVFSPRGDALFSGGMDGGLKSWQTRSGNLLATLRESGPFFSSLVTSVDGRWLAAGGDDRRISVWELTGQTQRLIDGLKNFGVSHQAFGPQSDFLLASFWDRSLRAYSIPTGELLATWNFPFNVHYIDFSRDGHWLALSLEDGTVRLWGIQ